jgi:HAD superfamily hydrolase (TIGR01509 family)
MLFDLWGTLIQADGPEEGRIRGELRQRMVSDSLAALGLVYEQHRMAEAFECAGTELARVHESGRDLTAEGRTVLYVRHLDPELGDKLDPGAWDRLHKAILTPALSTRPPVIPEAAETLRDVKGLGLSMGLISNAGITPGFVLREILAGHGLLDHFDDTIFSDEVEMSKPTTAIFEMALDAFGVAPEDAAFVGDQPVLDVLGPQSAGMRAIQIGDIASDGITPDERIASLGELLPALRRLGLIV